MGPKMEFALFSDVLFLDWLIVCFIIYFQIWPVSIVNRDKGLDDFIVAAPRFITLSARDRKTSILRAPINTLLYKKAMHMPILSSKWVMSFFISCKKTVVVHITHPENFDIFFMNQKLWS